MYWVGHRGVVCGERCSEVRRAARLLATGWWVAGSAGHVYRVSFGIDVYPCVDLFFLMYITRTCNTYIVLANLRYVLIVYH
ncbi:hypothetical protein F4604DRAFT_1716457, partial [Suillus subluteus]